MILSIACILYRVCSKELQYVPRAANNAFPGLPCSIVVCPAGYRYQLGNRQTRHFEYSCACGRQLFTKQPVHRPYRFARVQTSAAQLTSTTRNLPRHIPQDKKACCWPPPPAHPLPTARCRTREKTNYGQKLRIATQKTAQA